MGTPAPREAMEVVGKRSELVTCLLDGPQDTRDLVDALGASRSTVYRGTRELEALRLVEQDGGKYHLTTFGRLVVELYDSFYENLKTLCELETPLSDLPREANLPADVFCGGEVVHAVSHDPDRPVDAFEQAVREASRLQGFSPITRSRYVELFANELRSGSLEAELLTTTSVVTYLVSEYADVMEDVFALENFRFFTTEEPLPYELIVVEEPEPFVGISLYDSRQNMRAFVTNHDADAIAWGRAQFESYRELAECVTD
ncbi:MULTISPECIES: winged helix-turn-helix domain-containing protein [unclassified Haladaptatus]|uniref:helix-turn-helix transcriptional regulator n=1 Tax=unclassified Haladaptatus TaxID=2622732 RepID=UPI0023E8D082|nr:MULTISPECIES: helix-turn-helix domain-containing protein [unclassified Haladaptatus]